MKQDISLKNTFNFNFVLFGKACTKCSIAHSYAASLAHAQKYNMDCSAFVAYFNKVFCKLLKRKIITLKI